jgi:hypothetical protein
MHYMLITYYFSGYLPVRGQIGQAELYDTYKKEVPSKKISLEEMLSDASRISIRGVIPNISPGKYMLNILFCWSFLDRRLMTTYDYNK